jgi:hypothetical protein
MQAGDDVDLEHLAEHRAFSAAPEPRRSSPARRAGAASALVLELRHDFRAQLRVGAQHAVVAHHVEPRRRDERGDARTEVERLEHERDCAVAPGLLEHVAQPPVAGLDQALLRQGRAKEIPTKPLEASPVTCRHRDLGVHVDAEALAHPLGHASLALVHDVYWPVGTHEDEGAECVAHVHAVEHDHVEVHVESQRRVAALHDAHRAGVRPRPRGQLGSPPQTLRAWPHRAAGRSPRAYAVQGREHTHCRTGTSGITFWARCTAVSEGRKGKRAGRGRGSGASRRHYCRAAASFRRAREGQRARKGADRAIELFDRPAPCRPPASVRARQEGQRARKARGWRGSGAGSLDGGGSNPRSRTSRADAPGSRSRGEERIEVCVSQHRRGGGAGVASGSGAGVRDRAGRGRGGLRGGGDRGGPRGCVAGDGPRLSRGGLAAHRVADGAPSVVAPSAKERPVCAERRLGDRL